jgi:type IV secretion system protein TrbG
MRQWWMFIGLCLAGCASTPEVVKAPPVAEDLVGWSTPAVAAESPEVGERQNLPTEPTKARSAEERVYPFTPGASQRVDVGVGVPLDLIFQPGEEIHNIVEGDRAPADPQDQTLRWDIKQGYSGLGQRGRPHVFVGVTKPGLTTSLVVTTTRRVYYLDLRAVAKNPVRSVRWTYDDDPRVAKPKPRLLPDPSQPQRYHVGYEIQTSDPKPVWAVRQVVDNGSKTYLIFPPTLQTIEAPLVRAVGVNGPELINSRQVGSVIVLDRIINRVELRLGSGKTADTVTVTRQAPRTISCPDPSEPECPVWPHDVLARQEGRP